MIVKKITGLALACCTATGCFGPQGQEQNQEAETPMIAGVAPDDLIVEGRIADVQAAINAGKTSCAAVVEAYIERIETFDQASHMNAITFKLYDRAREQARRVDASDERPPLFCTPILVKDNIDVAGIPTTAGSEMLSDNVPPDNALIIDRLEAAGAILLAKTNMAEWAFSAKRTESTSAGITANAYNLDYTPAGSSGGTASGVASSFALAGLGTDTGNSIRGPSSHLSLVGMRSTHGLVSLDGIVPLVLSSDVVGPITRTVEDNARMLSVLVGDGADYSAALESEGLKGARIGVVRELATVEDTDPQVMALFNAALEDMKNAGAIIVDPAPIPNIKEDLEASWGCRSFRKDVHEYLTQPGINAKIDDPMQAFEAGTYAPYTQGAWEWFGQAGVDVATRADGTPCGDPSQNEVRQRIKNDLLTALDDSRLDALVYPSWRYPPARLDRVEEDYKGDNSQRLAPPSGLPALTVPMGFTYENLPAGIQFLGRANGEAGLYELGYGYEQTTQHRRPPSACCQSQTDAGD
ncbi:amidase [Hyphomonas sp.]|uniref:amidase n=1 Tax=Hyphomonas sp. TaxID=87 RepID=UPI0035288075